MSKRMEGLQELVVQDDLEGGLERGHQKEQKPEGQVGRRHWRQRGMFDRVRRDREREPGQEMTPGGLKDIRVWRRKMRELRNERNDTQVGYRAPKSWVKEMKDTTLEEGVTLYGYAKVTHAFRKAYGVLEEELDRLRREAETEGVALLAYFRERLKKRSG